MAKVWVEHGQTRKLGEMKPHPRNSRTHSDQQIDQIAAAMEQWDWTTPMLIDDKGTILAGHGRQLAGIKKWGAGREVPVSIAHGWTDAKKRAYIIADNRLTEIGQWNTDLLKAELTELRGSTFDLKPMGFTKLDADAIISPPAPAAGKGSRTPGTVIQTTIIFDTPEQQQTWFNFVRRLKAQYQQQVTFAAKLDEFLKEQLGDAKG